MDFSSIAFRGIVPDGRGNISGVGLFCAGSAGSFSIGTCAASRAVEEAMSPRSNTAGARIVAARRPGFGRKQIIYRSPGEREATCSLGILACSGARLGKQAEKLAI